MVSNLDQTQSTDTTLLDDYFDVAQEFTAGAHSHGYRLTAVTAVLYITGAGPDRNYSATIWTADSMGRPETKVGALETPQLPDTAGYHNVKFPTRCPNCILLQPSSNYVVVSDIPRSGKLGGYAYTDNNGQSGERYWRIRDNSRTRLADTTGNWGTSFSESLKIEVEGAQLPAPPPSITSFTYDSTDLLTGDIFTVRILFSYLIDVAPADRVGPFLKLNIGERTVLTDTCVKTDSAELSCEYVVQAADQDHDRLSIPANALVARMAPPSYVTVTRRGMKTIISTLAHDASTAPTPRVNFNTAPVVDAAAFNSSPGHDQSYDTGDEIKMSLIFTSGMLSVPEPGEGEEPAPRRSSSS